MLFGKSWDLLHRRVLVRFLIAISVLMKTFGSGDKTVNRYFCDDRTVLFRFQLLLSSGGNFWLTEVSFRKQKCPLGGQNCPLILANDRSVLLSKIFGQECPFPFV